MSKKFSLETSGITFTNKVINLHKTKYSYRKVNASLAEQLLSCGIETGVTLQNYLRSGVRQEKLAYAQEAVSLVNKTLFIVSIMETNKIYKPGQTKNLIKYSNNLRTVLDQQITKLSTPVVITKPANPAEIIVPEPIVVTKYANPEPFEDDGFDDLYIEEDDGE